jgi:transposase
LRYLVGVVIKVDLTAIPGISALTAHTIFTEIGLEIHRFKTRRHFTSWLSLSPNNKISGNKILSSKTLSSANRVAKALRLAAYGVGNSKSYIGDYYRKMRARLGAPKAITATAHKLAKSSMYC